MATTTTTGGEGDGAMAPPPPPGTARFAQGEADDFSQAARALYERELARGVGEDEEILTAEETLTKSKPSWANKHRPRKPRYFNRVQMGYEWNKYNQTHYDHDNPPPKVVHGYRFNIFYPDLIDKSKAPTFKIIREGGRRRGETVAPAGQEDTCLIRFIAGPPYEDIAFRIVDKEWDYSAKRERGFRSSFDKVCFWFLSSNFFSQYFAASSPSHPPRRSPPPSLERGGRNSIFFLFLLHNHAHLQNSITLRAADRLAGPLAAKTSCTQEHGVFIPRHPAAVTPVMAAHQPNSPWLLAFRATRCFLRGMWLTM
jgi:hypothetical protein